MRRVGALFTMAVLSGNSAIAAPEQWLAECTRDNGVQLTTDFENAVVSIDADGSPQRARMRGAPSAIACESRNSIARVRPRIAGQVDVQYQGGNLTERSAEVIADPENAGNKILRFRLQAPNVRNARGQPDKGRVQLNVYGNRGVREVRARMRMRLGDGMADIRQYPGSVDWLTISEWWNDGDWLKSPYPFRVSVNLVKSKSRSGGALRFSAHAQTFDRSLKKWTPTLWKVTDDSFDVPVGKWMTLEYLWREGNETDGHFSLTVTPEGQTAHSVFEVTGWTQHPNAVKPNGLANFNPMKLYTSRELVDFIRGRGKSLEIDWDDLDFDLCTAPGSPQCRPAAEGGK